MKPFQSFPIILLAFTLIPSACILFICLMFSQPSQLCIALSVVVLLIALLCAWYWSSRAVVQVQRLYQATRRDDLTGVFLYGALEDLVDRRLAASDTCAGFFLVDIDYFQHFNEQFGHLRGDKTLVGLTDELRYIFSEEALIGRVGSNTFAVFVDGPMEEKACRILMERLFQSLRQRASFPRGAVTLSGGICLSEDGDRFQTLYGRAGLALARAKNTGRNRYCFDTELVLS